MFEPRKLTTDTADFTEYGMLELDELSAWYGGSKTESRVSRQPPDANPVKLKQEWRGFLSAMSERRKMYQHRVDIKLLRTNLQEDRESLQKEKKSINNVSDTHQDAVNWKLYPQCMYQLELSINISVGSCVRRKVIFKNESS